MEYCQGKSHLVKKDCLDGRVNAAKKRLKIHKLQDKLMRLWRFAIVTHPRTVNQ